MKNQQELQEELIIAIAQAAGWTDCRLVIKGAGGGTRSPTAHGKPPNRKYEAPCPRYTIDLNAMHQAEEVLKDKGLFSSYLSNLALVCGFKAQGDEAWNRLHVGLEKVVSATALQRAKAFKETLS